MSSFLCNVDIYNTNWICILLKMIALLNLTFILMPHNNYCLLLGYLQGLQKKNISWYYSFHLNKIFRILFFWWTKAFLTQLDDTLPMFFGAFILYMSIMNYMYLILTNTLLL